MGPRHVGRSLGGDAPGETPLTGLVASEVLFTGEATEALRRLDASRDPSAHSIRRRVAALRLILRSDCLHGEVVKKDRIPRAFKARYAISNLYVEDLPGFWRLLYTAGRRGRERYVTVVAIVNHQTYDKLFGPRHV